MTDTPQKRNGRPCRLSDARIQQAYKMILNGMSYAETAAEMRVSVEYLYKRFYQNGLKVRGELAERGRLLRTYTPERARRIEQLVAEGKTIKAACVLTDITQSTLRKWRTLGLVKLAPQKGNARRHSDEEMRRAYKRYSEQPNESVKSIADIYGLTPNHLRKRWRRLGFKVDLRRSYARRTLDHCCKLSNIEAAHAWDLYRRGKGTLQEIACHMGIDKDRLKSMWRAMDYDVDGMTRKRYDDIHGKGSYDRRLALLAEKRKRREQNATD